MTFIVTLELSPIVRGISTLFKFYRCTSLLSNTSDAHFIVGTSWHAEKGNNQRFESSRMQIFVVVSLCDKNERQKSKSLSELLDCVTGSIRFNARNLSVHFRLT